MAPRHWPTEARELYRVLYEHEDSDCIRGLPLRKGISEPYFAELVVGCFYNYIERARRWDAHDAAMHRQLHRPNCDHLKRISRAGAAWPWAKSHAKAAFQEADALRRHHDEAAARARADGRYFDPVMCLYALFRYFVEPTRLADQERDGDHEAGIEFYMTSYFPRVLTAAGFPRWQGDVEAKDEADRRRIREKIARHVRRRGGKRTADVIAYWLMSTDDRLMTFRPVRPAIMGAPPDPQHAHLIDASIGNALFRLQPSRKAAPRKPSRGGQHPHGSR